MSPTAVEPPPGAGGMDTVDKYADKFFSSPASKASCVSSEDQVPWSSRSSTEPPDQVGAGCCGFLVHLYPC